jgi:hypothetical protein
MRVEILRPLALVSNHYLKNYFEVQLYCGNESGVFKIHGKFSRAFFIQSKLRIVEKMSNNFLQINWHTGAKTSSLESLEKRVDGQSRGLDDETIGQKSRLPLDKSKPILTRVSRPGDH